MGQVTGPEGIEVLCIYIAYSDFVHVPTRDFPFGFILSSILP